VAGAERIRRESPERAEDIIKPGRLIGGKGIVAAPKGLWLVLVALRAAFFVPPAHAGPLVKNPAPLRQPVAATGASNFTWTAGTDVTVSPLNTEDAYAGVVQNGSTLWVETSLYPNWYRFSGTTLDNLVAQPMAVRDPTTFNQPNKDDAYWTDSIWQDPGGTWYAIIHIEYDYAVPRTSFLWKRRIGLASSTNQGANWTYVGDIITPNLSRAAAPTVMGAPAPAASLQDFGCGDTYMFVDRRGGYFYLYYLTAWVYSSTGSRTNEVMSVARCAISDEMAPGKWFKWSGGTWTQPGLGGAEDAVFDGTSPAANAPFVGTDMSVVHFNTYLNAFVAIGHDSNSQAWISTCTDITKQQWTAGDYTFPQRLYWYNWPVDPVTHDPYEIGQNFRLYSSQADTSGVASKYFPITLSNNGNIAPTASLTAPAEGAVAFTSNPLSLAAAATAPDGAVAKVEFFANQVEIGTVTNSPYVFTWPNVATGQYRCSVRVTDNLGVATDSAGVDVTVTPITYALWRTANGIPASASDTAVQSNGLSPLVSYGLNIYSVTGLPQAQLSSGNLTLTYSAPRPDVAYLVQSSPDLVNWTSNQVNQGTPSSTNPITASVPFSIQSNGKLFLRLQISYP
jgi:hypothetical protein